MELTLEEILQLCQAYGVTSLKTREYDLTLQPLGMSEIDYGDEEDFQVDVNELKILDNN